MKMYLDGPAMFFPSFYAFSIYLYVNYIHPCFAKS
uniref:Uncharacterized protein n=1 Tax=Utricularia reniformis TaxID=192314 RepID=A0A1Y0B078_9LAMI|nr:hypothetical protein AEK19_MT0522 [Utricularia reniformis]ART30778.1 hypothetical protein AEK19_MT0522 [Utricularia reniformis]